ncbi:hypothetical protein, partial [Streptomyces mirabilis]|uniref:hypothetical protein n=1 Tax=Streptomyces mirabilis TaxID=68239 RepID=UPI0036D95C97
RHPALPTPPTTIAINKANDTGLLESRISQRSPSAGGGFNFVDVTQEQPGVRSRRMSPMSGPVRELEERALKIML